MIRIGVSLDEGGILRSCDISGHANAGPAGGDPVCAAVSVLAKTALRVLAQGNGITVRGGPGERGVFFMETDYTAAGRDFLAVAGAFLIEGLRAVSEEYPNFCMMSIAMIPTKKTKRRN